ncbi:MAG: PTS lactose/cellobiose transporter subunit IIA [Bacillota bacterium]
MNHDEYEQTIGELITQAGSAKNTIFAALDAAIEGDFDKAGQLLEQADLALSEAHRVHARFLELEALGEAGAPSFLSVHALDILMTAMSERDMARRVVALAARCWSTGR